ncbi:GerMN domain-containing protein [Nonomuraea sp. NPDC050310]|uniref:GerMN domain-containing protein n=1 Tax=unclassified Nonomuraea TaxID=2593643 RepID=UPI0034041BED
MKELILAMTLALPQGPGHPVKVYFPVEVDYPPKVAAVVRNAPTSGVARFAVEQFIAGPTKAERKKGLFSHLKLAGLSDCGGPDFKLTVKSGTARVRFCRTPYGPGHLADYAIKYSLERTLKQFPSIKKVVLANPDGTCAFSESGLPRC